MKKAKEVMLPLEAPDLKRCQTIRRSGSFLSMGGIPKETRCREKAVWIATEAKPGKDGRRGSMSVCDGCQEKLKKQLGPGYATFERIGR